MEFEDFSQPMNRASSDSSLGTPRGPSDVRVDPRLLGKNKAKRWPFSKKNKVGEARVLGCTLQWRLPGLSLIPG